MIVILSYLGRKTRKSSVCAEHLFQIFSICCWLNLQLCRTECICKQMQINNKKGKLNTFRKPIKCEEIRIESCL